MLSSLFRMRKDRIGPNSRSPTRRRDCRRLNVDLLEERRMLAAGDLDPSFGTDGVVLTDIGGLPTDDFAHGVASVVQADGKLGDIGTVAFIIGAACLYTSFYRTRLIPRWLSGWGLVAAVPYLVNYLLHFFDSDPGLFFLVLPLAVQEMVMGLWLIIKGFSPDAVNELDGTRPPRPRRQQPLPLLRAARRAPRTSSALPSGYSWAAHGRCCSRMYTLLGLMRACSWGRPKSSVGCRMKY
mgnify:CR=1 FL=1